MSIKSFIKSASFKSIIVLLCTLLISGIFLTFANALLKVSDQEKFDRAMQAIYGGPVETKVVEITSKDVTNIGDAEILEAYEVTNDNGNYLVKSKGNGGYDGGSVTCWVVVAMNNNNITGVKKVVIDSNEKQSYINRIGQDVLDAFTTLYKTNIEYSQELLTGATVVATKTALCNSVNGALNFVKNKVGIVVEEKTPYDEFEYTSYINKKTTTHNFENGIITYVINTKQNGLIPNPYTITVGVDASTGAITSYTIDKFGSYAYDKDYPSLEYGKKFETYLVGKTANDIKAILGDNEDLKIGNSTIKDFADGDTVFTGATESNFVCLYAALFATANYDKALEGAYAYTQYINSSTTYSVEGDVVTYSIITKINENAQKFELTITVGADKTISAITVNKNGSTGEPFTSWTYDASNLVNKSTDDILSLIGTLLKDNGKYNSGAENGSGDLNTGATQSSFLIAYSALYATANYDLAIVVGGAN